LFRRILIANRGEIALRILRTCRALGIETVVAHSEADRGAPWLRQADRTISIGPARTEDSYLDETSVLEAAEQCDCQAIHPGYGFLAENARFAARCEQQGIAFIGPPAGAIRRMGDKLEAKRTMAAAGLVPIPGPLRPLRDVESALRAAAEVGYPVLLKAVSGGGGRGMRRCDSEAELRRWFPVASREAEKAFGDPSLYLEVFLEGGRHIEFQVLADAFGNAIHLGERDCSIQRHHQKLVEESPSVVVDGALRSRVGETVARAVAGAGYRNAGTVEFLRSQEGTLYFMEMNTRLQVEHPVTEMVTGTDLVALQIRIAAFEPLPLEQENIELRGHAVEFRINAEDPERGFRPDPGTITAFVPPPERLGEARVRWDSPIEAGYRIPPHYDSLVGKLVVHAADRNRALSAARECLERIRIEGVHTTIGFHRQLLSDPDFLRGAYDLGFLGRKGLAQPVR
jgi:acetyl-CoA carboxylase biotin carboxylase subunit